MGDVGTVDSGLNSMVLSSNNEMVLLPTNEPTFGTKRKSQIQTYLEQNAGAGVQHVAIKTDDIFRTMGAEEALRAGRLRVHAESLRQVLPGASRKDRRRPHQGAVRAIGGPRPAR